MSQVDPQSQEAPIEEFHLRDYLEILDRHRWSALSVAALVFVVSLAFSLMTPKIYQGACKISITRSDPDVDVDRSMGFFAGRDAYFQTQLQILKSWPVYFEVAKRLELHKKQMVAPHPVKTWIRSALAMLSGKTRKKNVPSIESVGKGLKNLVKVKEIRSSDVVTLTVQVGDPELARDIVNTTAEVFAERSLSFKREKLFRDRKYLAEKLQSTKGDLIDAENELRRFEDEKDAISLQKRIDYVSTLRIQGAGELSDVKRQAKEIEAKLGSLLKQLSKARKGVATASSEAYAGLQQRLLDLRLKKASLLKIYTPEHPNVRAVDEELTLVEVRVKSAEKALLIGESGSVSGMETVVRNYNERLQDLEGLGSREASLKQVLTSYQKQLKDLLALQSQHDFLMREVDANRRVYDLLLIRQKEASLKADMEIADVRVIEPAQTDFKVISPRKFRSLVASAVAGFFLGVCMAFFRAYMDQTVHDGRRLEQDLGIPCLAYIPQAEPLPEGTKHNGNLGGLADAITLLGLSRELGTPDDPANVYLVTSPEPSEGKSTIASSLAVSFSQGGERTLLIDCDLRRPRQHRIFDLGEEPLTVLDTLEHFPEEFPTLEAIENLTVIGAGGLGDLSPVQVFGRQTFPQVLVKLRRKFDRIILDSPPVNVISDGLHLAPLVDRILLVARSEVSKVGSVERAAKSLEDVRGRVAGLVINAVPPSSYSTYQYGYRSYGRYAYSYTYE